MKLLLEMAMDCSAVARTDTKIDNNKHSSKYHMGMGERDEYQGSEIKPDDGFWKNELK